MVLFLLLSLPLSFIVVLQFMPDRKSFSVSTHRVIRNPLVAGASFYFAYLVLQMIIFPFFPLEYRWADAFWIFLLTDVILPFAVAGVIFFLLYIRGWSWEIPAHRMAFQSFLFGFLLFFPFQDLVNYINELKPADLFFRPLTRLVFFLVLPWSLEVLRLWGRDVRVFFLESVNLLVLALLSSAAFAFAMIGLYWPAVLCMLIPVAETILLLVWKTVARGFAPVRQGI